jgi:hypothetical protein
MNELLTTLVGPQRCERLLADVAIPPQLAGDEQPRGQLSRAAVAMAMSLVLFEDLLARVPSGARYVASQRERGRQVVFDHGAVRTVDWHETGQLPPGAELFRRLLNPLGYQEVGLYPLDRIHMTGRVFTHADVPEQVPQYFVSELHVDRLDPEAREAVTRTVGNSADPLRDEALSLLDDLAGRGWMALDDAAHLILMLAPCFGRHHRDPRLDDYKTLLRDSAEMAWDRDRGQRLQPRHRPGPQRRGAGRSAAPRLVPEGQGRTLPQRAGPPDGPAGRPGRAPVSGCQRSQHHSNGPRLIFRVHHPRLPARRQARPHLRCRQRPRHLPHDLTPTARPITVAAFLTSPRRRLGTGGGQQAYDTASLLSSRSSSA